jgi:hypothetical protein
MGQRYNRCALSQVYVHLSMLTEADSKGIVATAHVIVRDGCGLVVIATGGMDTYAN